MSTPAKVTAIVCLTVAAFLAGKLSDLPSAASSSRTSTTTSSSRPVLYWACPMHPQYKSDRPGDAPCCGMRLEPVYADSPGKAAAAALPNGAVEVGSSQQQLIGVRTDVVKRARTQYLLRLPGRVTPDEARVHRLVAGADGWIRKLGENSAGTFVKKNQVLASYYAPNLMALQQAFTFAIRSIDPSNRAEVMLNQQSTPNTLSFQAAIDALRNLGMSDVQMKEIERTRMPFSEINIYSPVDGFVIARTLSPAQRFEKGSELYRIGDISHVWVMTDIFEKDRELLKPGAVATVRYPGREFRARMSDVLAQIDPQSRTLKTRFELENPGQVLRPDAFVTVEVQVNMPEAVTAPADAVIDSGRRRTVFVERAPGVFDPRPVETGWRLGDRVQITRGLEPGERIVTSGNFLIDSESRMKFAATGSVPAPVEPHAAAVSVPVQPGAAAVKDPVCGMQVDPKKANVLKHDHAGKTYYFCSGQCKKSFEENPGKYTSGKLAAEPAGGKTGTA